MWGLLMDTIDVAQQRQLEDIERALKSRQQPSKGLAVCSMLDCDEPIAPLRQSMGATLCIDCAKANEQEARRWSPRAAR